MQKRDMSEGSQPSSGAAPIRVQVDERSVTVPAIYFNGFNVSLTNSDINSLLLLDGRPIARLNMSYTTAKTVVALLGQLVDTLEEITGREIMTTEVVAEGLKKHRDERSRGASQTASGKKA